MLSNPSRLRRAASTVALAVTVLAGTLAAAPAATGGTDVGYVGPSYGDPATGAGTVAPTSEKPESKLWYAYGQWWGALWDSTSSDFHVFGYSMANHTWTDTGSTIETRTKVWMDVLWDGSHLFVVSTTSTKTPGALTVSRYTYDTATGRWGQDVAPTEIARGWIYSPVIDEDSTGTLWVTYTIGTDVMVAHSTAADGSAWTAPYVLPTPNQESTVSFDPVKDPKQPSSDISTVVSYDGNKIGVLWSNQRTYKVYWASHTDGDNDQKWTLDTAYSGPRGADDHLNIKSIAGDASGLVYAVAKTSNTSPSDPLINLLVLGHDGSWSAHPYSTVADNLTRATVLIDGTNRELYVFASAPCCNGGEIFYKKTSLTNPHFGPGVGTRFISSAANPKINNPTSTKQTLTADTGLLVLAGDDTTRHYLYNDMALGSAPTPPPADTTAPETTITGGPAGKTTDRSADFQFTADEAGSTFACRLDGGAWQDCTSPQSYSRLATGSHTFEVRATDAAGNTDASPATRGWTVLSAPHAVRSFADDFSSARLSRAGWTVQHQGGAVAAVVRGAVFRHNRGVLLATRAGHGSRATVRHGLSGRHDALDVSWNLRLAADGRRGDRTSLASVYAPSGRRLLSLVHVAKTRRLLVVDARGRVVGVSGPRLGRVTRVAVQLRHSAHGRDVWTLSLNGRAVARRRGAGELGRFASVGFGETHRGHRLVYGIDDVRLRW